MRPLLSPVLLSIVLLVCATSRAHAAPVDFIDEAKELLVVGACAEGTSTKVKEPVYAAHCKRVRAAQAEYKKSWLGLATEFFTANVPAGIPKTVVYPFAGGDLSTALTVFPDADEITTLSLEPAGDARALSKLTESQIKTALGPVATELEAIYKATFSRTMAMIGAMRGGQLPTQLIFSLSALLIHGYEPVSLKYFDLSDAGEIRYLEKADFDRIDAIKDLGKRNEALANIELRFHKIGSKHEQVYRHILANLDDKHLKAKPAALKHLEKKGRVSAMTKAASFLLSMDDFKTIRNYLVENVDWMVSDASGVAPKWGKAAGYEYEVYGTFERSEMDAGIGISPSWIAEYKAQPKRPLKFRFGYPDVKYHHNLMIMRKPKKAV
jgi:hypothetical protein